MLIIKKKKTIKLLHLKIHCHLTGHSPADDQNLRDLPDTQGQNSYQVIGMGINLRPKITSRNLQTCKLLVAVFDGEVCFYKNPFNSNLEANHQC